MPPIDRYGISAPLLGICPWEVVSNRDAVAAALRDDPELLASLSYLAHAFQSSTVSIGLLARLRCGGADGEPASSREVGVRVEPSGVAVLVDEQAAELARAAELKLDEFIELEVVNTA